MKDERPLQVADGADSSMAASTLAQGSPAPARVSSSLVEPLTPRELDVLALLAQGLTNKEIAQRLVISPGTVKQHAYNLYQKLQVSNRQQAVNKASDLGILIPE
jgi:LuxR family maltose regulon positive regulatory protein